MNSQQRRKIVRALKRGETFRDYDRHTWVRYLGGRVSLGRGWIAGHYAKYLANAGLGQVLPEEGRKP